MSNYAIMMEWAKGDEGALSFLAKVNKLEAHEVERIVDPLLCMNQIRGPKLFNLWILAERDMEQCYRILEVVPEHLLEEACGMKDRKEAKRLIQKML